MSLSAAVLLVSLLLLTSIPVFSSREAGSPTSPGLASVPHSGDEREPSSTELPFEIPVGYGPSTALIVPPTGTVWVANVESQNLSVINVANYSVEETIPYGATLDYGASDLPGSAAYDPTSEQVYVVGELTGDVLAYDVLNYSLAAVIPVGTNPTSISFDSVDGDLYVANAGSSNLSVISGRHDNITATISLPSGLTSSPEEVACDGRGDVYVSNSDGNMTIVNDTNNTVAATEQLPGYSGGVPTFGFGYDPLDHIEYATDTTSDALFAFNGTRFMGMTNLSASQTSMVTPVGLAFDGLDRTLYVSMFNGSVLGLNATTLSQTDVADVNGAPRGLADDSSDGRLYVAGSGYPGDDVAVLATSALNLSKFAFGPSVIRIQHSTNESLLVAGGLTPYRYTYSNLPPGCSSVNVTNLICAPAGSGALRRISPYLTGPGMQSLLRLPSRYSPSRVFRLPSKRRVSRSAPSGTSASMVYGRVALPARFSSTNRTAPTSVTLSRRFEPTGFLWKGGVSTSQASPSTSLFDSPPSPP